MDKDNGDTSGCSRRATGNDINRLSDPVYKELWVPSLVGRKHQQHLITSSLHHYQNHHHHYYYYYYYI